MVPRSFSQTPRAAGLYSALFKTRFASMQQYVDHVLSIAEQLEAIGQPSACSLIKFY